MMMKRMTSRKAIPLFDDRALAGTADGELRARLREFAQAVARRHRRSKAGLAEFVPALRGYYRTLAICSDVALPPLEESLVAYATRAYSAVRANGHTVAA